MTSPSRTILPQLAEIELGVMAELEKTQAECEKTIAAARRACEEEIAELPSLLQEERRLLIKNTREQAEHRAEQIRAEAENKATRLSTVIDKHTGELVEELVTLVLPGPPEISDGDQQ